MQLIDLNKQYDGIDKLDIDLIISLVLKKPREFVLAHPETKMTKAQKTRCKKLISRRLNHEPMAYILGQKEFYSLDFKVSKNTLIPRPETELLVDFALRELASDNHQPTIIIDVGTGSGNIIISLARNMKHKTCDKIKLFGIDFFSEALTIAKHNARKNKVDKKIKFIKGNLLEPIIENYKLKIVNSRILILANLPYLSKKIYDATEPDVKNFEPKSSLLSLNNGLAHYEKLFQQTKILKAKSYKPKIILEFSPEQKIILQKLIKKYFPKSFPKFHKDLSGKWRVADFKV